MGNHKNIINVCAKEKQGEPNTQFFQVWRPHETGYTGSIKTIQILPANAYDIAYRNQYLTFTPQDLLIDDLIDFPQTKSHSIISEIKEFWKKEKLFKECGFIYKRGVLLHGPPGSGKTALIMQLAKELIKDNGIVFFCTSPGVCKEGIQMFRKIEPSRNLIIILEDLDLLIEKFEENLFLSLLDGEDGTHNVVFIATTNYPEKLEKRFTNRPSRFDCVVKVELPNEETRKLYLQHKIKLNPQELEKWVSSTVGLSLAHLKEIIISVKCFSRDFEESLKTVKNMKATLKSDSNSRIGLLSEN